jgi:uncharacterized membrane protein
LSDKRRTTKVAEENIRAVARVQNEAAQRRGMGERITDAVSAVAARETTIVLHAAFFSAWIVANLGWLPIRPFDPFPFPVLVTIVSLEAIFLTMFVLASQKRMTADADHRAHLDLQVNLLAEQEMTLVLQMLREVCDQLGIQGTAHSEKFNELVRRTDVAELAEHVQREVQGPPPPSETRKTGS